MYFWLEGKLESLS